MGISLSSVSALRDICLPSARDGPCWQLPSTLAGLHDSLDLLGCCVESVFRVRCAFAFEEYVPQFEALIAALVDHVQSRQCPEGKRLTYLGVNPRNRNHIYRATWKRCRDCLQKAQSTRGHYRQIAVHVHEAARQRARERTTVPVFAAAQRQRRKVEPLFAELKNQIGPRRVRLRRMKHVREQFFLAAAAQNLKRLARLLRSRSLESATMPI